MRKSKSNKSSIEFELIDNISLNTPSPDFEMKYKDTDMYWEPIDNITTSNRKSNNVEDFLSIIT